MRVCLGAFSVVVETMFDSFLCRARAPGKRSGRMLRATLSLGGRRSANDRLLRHVSVIVDCCLCLRDPRHVTAWLPGGWTSDGLLL
jgi:hypothetical protein